MSRYNSFHENYIKAFETFREIYWEAKRAPTIQHTMLVNPYRREKLIKRFYGKYVEQRRLMRTQLKEVALTHIQNVATKLMEADLRENDTKQKNSAKLRGYAKKRAELGFKDDGAEEVED